MTAGSPEPFFYGPVLSISLQAGTRLFRIHGIRHGPLWFGPEPGRPPAYRFDSPDGKYRMLYASQSLEGAFAETVLRGARRLIARPYVNLRAWSVLEARRALRLAQLFDNGLLHHGVTGDICAGDDYRAPQSLAAVFFARDATLDGIAYRSRHDNGQFCYALFDRADPVHPHPVETRHFVNEPAITEALMRRYNASWDPLTPPPPP